LLAISKRRSSSFQGLKKRWSMTRVEGSMGPNLTTGRSDAQRRVGAVFRTTKSSVSGLEDQSESADVPGAMSWKTARKKKKTRRREKGMRGRRA